MTDAVQIGRHTELRNTAHGLMLYNRLDWPISEHLIKYGECSWAEVEFLASLVRPEWTVVEAGAHIGTHTIPLAGMVKRVFAFEPQRANFNYLCANVALNECANVKATRCAIGAKDGEVTVPILDPDAANNTGGVILPEAKDGEKVPLRSLDSLDIPFDLLKADVENMEVDVLDGARRIIRECLPLLYLESNADASNLLAKLTEIDYEAWWHLPPIWRENNLYGVKEPLYKDLVAVNVLAAPIGRMSPPMTRLTTANACGLVAVPVSPA